MFNLWAFITKFSIYFFPCMLLKNNFQSNEHSVLRYEGNTSSNTHTCFQCELHVQQTCPAYCYHIISRSRRTRQSENTLKQLLLKTKPCLEVVWCTHRSTGVQTKWSECCSYPGHRAAAPSQQSHCSLLLASPSKLQLELHFLKCIYNMQHQKGCNNSKDSLGTILAINMLMCLRQLCILITILEHICLLSTHS